MNTGTTDVPAAPASPVAAAWHDAMPDEVVTRALIRDVALPGGAGTLALITLDNGRDHRRPTTFGPAGLAALDKTLDGVAARAAAGEIVAVGLTGKPFVFCAGADLGMFSLRVDRQSVGQIGRAGHEVFRRLGELPVPSFAFINGVALGGGLEIALHCTYRTISAAARSVGLPECFLGLLPGWGGTFLLANLVGPAPALEVIISNALNQNRTLSGPGAHALGLADAIFEPADFLEQSLVWAAGVVTGRVTVSRPDIDRDEDAWQTALAGGRAVADSKVHGAAPAPYRALDLVSLARAADRDTAFEAETQALADLAMSEELRSGLYAFDLVNKRAKQSTGAPSPSLARPVTAIGVVGAGLMASQLALLFVRRLEVPVVLTDLDQQRANNGVTWVHSEIDALARRRRITPDQANRYRTLVTGTGDKTAIAGADLVIEAVFEDLAVKQQVFSEVEAVVGPECVLMTNTSSLPVTAMAGQLQHPERLVGFHFFNPVAVLPLVEVIRGDRTDDTTVATAFAVGQQLRKSCVLVKDAPAFVVNRLLIRLLGEITQTVDEGTPAAVADSALLSLGLPMSPFMLLQLVGPAVALHVWQTLQAAFPDRFAVSENLRRLVEAGRTTLWSFDEQGKPSLDDETRSLMVIGDRPLTAEQVRERVLTAVAQEVRLMLDEGVVAAAQDIDLCMILGAGWPFHLGGITPYLDRVGVSAQVTGSRFLPRGLASLPD